MDAFEIDVGTHKGNVMPIGFIETPDQLDRAVEIGGKTAGGQKVKNKLEKKPKAISQSNPRN